MIRRHDGLRPLRDAALPVVYAATAVLTGGLAALTWLWALRVVVVLALTVASTVLVLKTTLASNDTYRW
jgi:predicted Kef-type K+ transport protein